MKSCPTGAIVFGTKEDMKQHAAERIEDLKSRGFERPAGRGRHPRHVRAAPRRPAGAVPRAAEGSADQPYGVAWKGIAAAVAAMALTALAGFFHYARVGRNEVHEEDERKAEEEARHE